MNKRRTIQQSENLLQAYCKALEQNNYDSILGLFSKGAKVFSYLAGEKTPEEFYKNLFENSTRTRVELKNIFLSPDHKTIAAYLYIEAVRNKKIHVNFEAVDIMEINLENKIKSIQVIMDTHPIRSLIE